MGYNQTLAKELIVRRSIRRTLILSAAALALASPRAMAEEPPKGPMDFFIGLTRAQLTAGGFTRHEAEIRGQPMIWWAKGDGPTVVMIHGVNDQAGTWFMVAPGLAESHRVLLVDLPAHGESGPATGPLPMTTVVEGFEEWLASHGMTEGQAPPVLVGNSMGAWVAMLAALRHPERVSRVVAVNGGPLRADPGELNLLPKDREEARRLMAALRDPGSLPTPDPVLDDLVRRGPSSQVSRMFEAEEDLESYLLDDSRLAEITTPVDLLWGESDRYMGREYPERLLAGLASARLTWVVKCGHVPQVECPPRFAEQLKAVLAQEPPPPPVRSVEGHGGSP